ncbi:hypothetical protein Btru_073303, partial [Bulinus truncatus]
MLVSWKPYAGNSKSGKIVMMIFTIDYYSYNKVGTIVVLDYHCQKLLKRRLEQWKSGAVAFFGPEDTCEVPSRVSAAWKMPIMAYKCDDPVVSDKDRFPTLARTQPPASHSVRSVMALIQFYNWTKFSIIVEQDGLMPRAGLNLATLASKNNMTVNHFVNISGPYSVFDPAHKMAVKNAVESTYVSTRIYVVFSREKMFAEFLTVMWDKGLTNSSKYVIIAVQNDMPWNETLSLSLIFQATDFTSKRDNVTMDLWKCVFMLNNVPITNPNYAQWEDTVREYLYKPPINFTRKPLDALLNIKVQIPVFAAYLYDSVMLYARELYRKLLTKARHQKMALLSSVSYENGDFRTTMSIICYSSTLTPPMVSQQCPSIVIDPPNLTHGQSTMSITCYSSTLTPPNGIQGHEVYLDMNGDAEANYTVLALRPMNNSYGRGLQPVGRFSRNSRNGQIVTYVMDVDVYGGDVPLDEPLCGYYGEWCREEASIVPAIIGGCLGGIGLILLIILTVSY